MSDGANAGQPAHAIRQAWTALTGWIGSAWAALPLDTLPSRLRAALSSRAGRLQAPLPAESLHRGLSLALSVLRRALRVVALVLAALVVTVLTLVVAYRWINPPLSTLMLGQSIAGIAIERTWVPLERISPHLIRAVVLSEDGRFCSHGGVDWRAIKDAIASDRGGSTITMQVVKNLFLWPSRSYVRKAIEMTLAYLVDALWPKRRILEIYLNIAEWGDGVFGAEAAARTHFSKPASRLTSREAALLAVALPNPLERSPSQPSAGTRRLAIRLMVRMGSTHVDLGCVRSMSWAMAAPQTAPARQTATRTATKERNKEGRPPVQGGPDGDDWDHLFSRTD